MHTSAEFALRGGDTAFANRQKLLFDQLSIAEKQHKVGDKNDYNLDHESMEIGNDDSSKSQRPPNRGLKRKNEMRRFCGKESIFKRPEGPAPRATFRGVPDHHRNPHKWTKYSLADVSNDDMTDTSNARAAFSFLRELKARKPTNDMQDLQEVMNVDIPECSMQDNGRRTFKPKKPSGSNVEYKRQPVDANKAGKPTVIVDKDDKPVFRSSKVIMPEYVVGQKQKKNKVKVDRSLLKTERSKQLKLDHLLETEESDN